MSFRSIAILAIISLSAWHAVTAHPAKETDMNSAQSQSEPRKHTHAEAKITVHSSEAKPYDQTPGPVLMEINISETFTGDLDGESTVRALQVQRDDKSACLVSMQRFRGKLGGRQGTFVLQGSEIVENGKIKATWFVVPGSGTAAWEKQPCPTPFDCTAS
jgi:hypothetical protein